MLTKPIEYECENGKIRFAINFCFTKNGEYIRLRRKGFVSFGEALQWAETQYHGIKGGFLPPPRKHNRVGRPRTISGLSFRETVEKLLPFWQIKESTMKIYLGQLDKYIYPLIGSKMFNAVSNSDLARIVEATADCKTDNAISVLRSIVACAAKQKWECPKLDFGDIEFKKKTRRAVFLSEDEISEFLGQLRPDLKPFFLFLVSTGLRFAEALGLEWKDVSLKEKYININKQFNITTNKISTTKSGKSREVPLITAAHNALKSQANLEGAEWKTSGRIFTNITRSTVNVALEKIKMKSGKHVTPHVLRHTYSSLLYQSGVGKDTIGDILGHADTTTTSIYTHFTRDSLRQAASVFPDIQL